MKAPSLSPAVRSPPYTPGKLPECLWGDLLGAHLHLTLPNTPDAKHGPEPAARLFHPVTTSPGPPHSQQGPCDISEGGCAYVA